MGVGAGFHIKTFPPMTGDKPTYEKLTQRIAELEAQLEKTQWLNEKENATNETTYVPFYGDVTILNTQRTILDAVGKETLETLTSELMDLLDTSVAVYERNGDYAYGVFNSGWCQQLDGASRELCNTCDNAVALSCGKWLCHDNCWLASKAAMDQRDTVVVDCVGGLRLIAEPIIAGDTVIGSINIGCGNPPTDDKSLKELSERFQIDYNTLRRKSLDYKTRPSFIVEVAKKRMKSTAKLIGEIVAHKRARERAEENEAILKAAMENSQAGIAIAEVPSGKLKYVNKAGLMIRNKENDEIVDGVDVDKYLMSWQLLHFDGTPFLVNEMPLARAVMYGERCSKEFIIRLNAHEDRFLLANAAPVFNSNNEQTAAIVVFMDITERKSTEMILKQNSDRLKILLNLSEMNEVDNDKLYDFALERAIELCNSTIGFLGFLNEDESFVKIHAWSASAMAMCQIQDKHIDFEVAKTGIWGEVVRQRKPMIINDFKSENPLKRGVPKGHVEVENYMSIPVFDKGKIVLIIAVGNKQGNYTETDIQELTLLMEGVWNVIKQRNYERDISEIAERFKALHNASFGGIVIHDKGKIIECNQGLSEISGYTYDELIGMDGLQLIAPGLRDLVMSKIREGYEKSYEAMGMRKNGDLYPLRLEARNIPYMGKKVRTVEFRDITDQKETEKRIVDANKLLEKSKSDLMVKNTELQLAKEKAEESDRLKTAFLHNISHEIRTPLNAISGFAGLLNKPDLTEEKRKSYVSIIQSSSNQLISIVTDILTISSIETKQEKLNVSDVCVNNVMVELLAIFNQQALNQNITLYASQQLSDSQSEIKTDRTKLTQVLTNLLTNALKFTHDGGVEFGYTQEDGFLLFHVKDSGIGIEPEYHDKIFERFGQADKSINKIYGGTGLGLAISKAFVELLGGKIWVESQPGNGSTFYFTIPYHRSNEANPPVLPAKQKEATKTILVAEDEVYNYLYIEELLMDFDIKLIHAKNGKEAVRFFNANPDIDLVLMDVKMPVMTGDEAAKAIKSSRPTIPIVAQSAYALDHERARFEGIFDDYLVKPIREDELRSKVKKYVGEE